MAQRAWVMSNERSTGSGHGAPGSQSMISTVPRSRTRSINRRATPCEGREGGRTTKRSTPSNRSAADSAHAPRGRGTNSTRRRSTPRSVIATTPGSSTPTTATQWPSVLASVTRLNARLSPPEPGCACTRTVEPRRSPPSGAKAFQGSPRGNRRLFAMVTGRKVAAKSSESFGRVAEKANICS